MWHLTQTSHHIGYLGDTGYLCAVGVAHIFGGCTSFAEYGGAASAAAGAAAVYGAQRARAGGAGGAHDEGARGAGGVSHRVRQEPGRHRGAGGVRAAGAVSGQPGRERPEAGEREPRRDAAAAGDGDPAGGHADPGLGHRAHEGARRKAEAPGVDVSDGCYDCAEAAGGSRQGHQDRGKVAEGVRRAEGM
ncbi:unnamed protein product [Phytophthora lilii]|uniref:Unnamed protein product n=1 Tax=Phytophthora lilii TaxID=2077276 RepID=A0A9W6TCB7_9STRA|nr:unnamed protein product [Phytophthora lilii]